MIANQGRKIPLRASWAFGTRTSIYVVMLVATFWIHRAEAALTFDVDFSPGVLGTPKAAGIVAGVHEATSTWSKIFRDDITVSVYVEMDSEATDIDLPTPHVFAAALNAFEEHSYLSVKTAMLMDAKSPADSASLALLQPGPFLEALTHDTSAGAPLGPGGSPEIRIGSLALGTTGAKAEAKWNSVLRVSRANSKALSLPVTADGAYDIRLVLNDDSVPIFDVDRTDGIEDMEFDFQAIATHEIGHGMGFLSGVDHIDFSGVGGFPVPMPAPGYPDDYSDEAIFTVLDLFRTNLDTRPPLIPLGQPPTGFVLDWRFGPPEMLGASKPFFTLDSMAIDPPMKLPFSTGAFLGDGGQSSHWADTPIGIMVPDLDDGIILDVSALDVLAFNVIGWDLVPEPSSGLLLLLGMGCAGMIRPSRPN